MDDGADPLYMKDHLLRYRRERYDWRKQERVLNDLSHFRATLGGTMTLFIHEPGRGPIP